MLQLACNIVRISAVMSPNDNSCLVAVHDTSIIHGDLTGVSLTDLDSFKLIQCQLKANVLIRHDGTACIADFGHSLMYSEALGILSQASSSFHGTIRWMAPELFEVPEDGLPVCPSKQGDIYSFGGIMLLVCREVLICRQAC
jgi:serine/threonine protein kinase